NDSVGEQDLGPRHVHRGEDVAGRAAAPLMVDEEVDEIDDHRRQQRSDQTLQQALGHEGDADEPVGGTDQLHHRDFTASGEDSHADGVQDQHGGGNDQDDGN